MQNDLKRKWAHSISFLLKKIVTSQNMTLWISTIILIVKCLLYTSCISIESYFGNKLQHFYDWPWYETYKLFLFIVVLEIGYELSILTYIFFLVPYFLRKSLEFYISSLILSNYDIKWRSLNLSFVLLVDACLHKIWSFSLQISARDGYNHKYILQNLAANDKCYSMTDDCCKEFITFL